MERQNQSQSAAGDLQPVPSLRTGRYYCIGCQEFQDGEPVVWFRCCSVCSADCFDRMAEADRLVTENPGPLPWWYVALSIAWIGFAAWLLTWGLA